MAQIVAERLIQMRKARKLTQGQRAELAKINKQTVYRLEKGTETARKKTIMALAQALNVDLEVLTGEKPLPSDINQPQHAGDEASYQLNKRVSAAVRNAYELAARKYGVSVQNIVQMAPLLFVILAEANFKHLAKTAEKYWEKRAEFRAVDSDLPHPGEYASSEDRDNEIEDLEGTIVKNDVFGRSLWKKKPPEGWDRDNPFCTYLQALARGKDDITINAAGPTYTDYRVCRAEAMDLVGNDQDAAERLLSGQVAIDRTFRSLKTAEERIEWIRENQIPESEMEGQIQKGSPEESWAADEVLSESLDFIID